MWQKLLFPMMISLFSMPAFAGIETLEVRGEGPDRNTAINAALVSAIEQVVGVDIKSQQHSIQQYAETEEGFAFNERNASKVNFGSAGSATYRILSEDCQSRKCIVRLLANVEYDDDKARQKKLKGMNAQRRTIAIDSFSGNQHAKELRRALEARLVQDRKFSVIADRSKAGIDYLVRANLLQANTKKTVKDTRKTLALTGEEVGEVKTTYRSKVLVEYQVVDLVNNQIKWSAKVTTTSSRNNLALLLDITSRKVFDQLKDNIYPLILISTADGNLVLNSGGQTVKTGERFDVFAIGEQINDPYTNESLGFTENKVGQVKVVRVQHKVAYVKITKGIKEDMLGMPIARRISGNSTKKAAKPVAKKISEEPSKPSSGIIL